MSALGKLCTRTSNKRLMDHLNPVLNEAQCRFQDGNRSCIDHVLSGSQVIQCRMREEIVETTMRYSLTIKGHLIRSGAMVYG